MKRILIVDDDLAILEVMTMLLESEDYHVVTVANGDKLKQALDKHKPDLVILDIWLPGLHGDALANWMRSEEKYKNIPIVLMSASNEAHKLAANAKVDACIDKPFDISHLTDTITRLLK